MRVKTSCSGCERMEVFLYESCKLFPELYKKNGGFRVTFVLLIEFYNRTTEMG